MHVSTTANSFMAPTFYNYHIQNWYTATSLMLLGNISKMLHSSCQCHVRYVRKEHVWYGKLYVFLPLQNGTDFKSVCWCSQNLIFEREKLQDSTTCALWNPSCMHACTYARTHAQM